MHEISGMFSSAGALSAEGEGDLDWGSQIFPCRRSKSFVEIFVESATDISSFNDGSDAWRLLGSVPLIEGVVQGWLQCVEDVFVLLPSVSGSVSS